MVQLNPHMNDVANSGAAIKCHRCLARSSALCGAMKGEDIAKLFNKGRAGQNSKGQYLFMEEAPSHHVYNLSAGTMMLERIGLDGRRQVVSFIYPGDYVGLMVGPQYNVSCCAVTDVEYCRWNLRDIESLGDEYPKLTRRLHIIANMVLSHTIDQIFILGRKNALERLAFFLLHTMQRQAHANMGQAHADMGSDRIYLPMTRTDIADHLGITIETVSRAFSKLVKDETIELQTPSHVTVLNEDRLRSRAEHSPG